MAKPDLEYTEDPSDHQLCDSTTAIDEKGQRRLGTRLTFVR